MKRHNIIDELGIESFKQRLPWIGGDLQTLRDTFVDEKLYLQISEVIQIRIPSKRVGDNSENEYLIAFLNRPLKVEQIKGLVLMIHGLGGSSRRRGLRRMASTLINSGFAVLRLNLRGAAPSRQFAAGSYAASCNSDIFPAIQKAREICKLLEKDLPSPTPIPLYGLGLSLGGTILLNACLEFESTILNNMALDGLVCISSPLDLATCSSSIEKPRNMIYQTWLLKRLVKQTLEDPFGLTTIERNILVGKNSWNLPLISSIKLFDTAITAPRWGYKDVNDYYQRASPINKLLSKSLDMIPKTLFLHSLDDPWVPANPAKELQERVMLNERACSKIDILITNKGGHNGFHGTNGCWGDLVVKRWLLKLTH